MPDESFTELRAARVTLRRFRPADTSAFVAYRTSPEVARYQGWDAPYSLAAGEQFIRQMMSQLPDTTGEWFQFAVELRSTGELAGDCGAMPLADDPRQVEIGFTIAPAHQGHGYATEAARRLLGYLFDARGKHRVTACHDARNLASAGVLGKLGMRREAHLRENTWAKGEWTDDICYALLDHEWKSMTTTEFLTG